MGLHTCSESNRLLRIEKILDGNARVGLIGEVEQHKIRIENMEKDLSSLATSYSALVKASYEADVTEKLRLRNEQLKIQRSEKRMQAWTKISIVFGISIPLTALIIQLI